MLITKRSQLDAAYHPKQESVSLACAGIFPFSEPVLATYIDLDRLIATCGLSNPQRRFVDMLMDGHTLSDIATLLGLTVQSVGMQYRRAIAKIVQRNNERWDSAYVVR